MATMTAVRTALSDNLNSLEGVQVSAYVLSNPQPPVIWVRPSPDTIIEYHRAMANGLEHWHFVVEAYVGTISDLGAQLKLDELLTSTGVKTALESDKTLGGVAQDVYVEDAHGYAEYARPDGGSSLLGCKWNVLVEMGGT